MPRSTSSNDESVTEHLRYKLVLLGGEAVGKSSIVQKLGQHDYQGTYTPTVGAEYYKAEVQITAGIHATLQIWDVGSHVSSLNMAANFVHGCDALLLVFDATRPETFAYARQWLELLQQMFQEAALPYVAFIANKVEDDALLTAATAQLQLATADVQQAYGYTLSAKTGQNLSTTFLRIAADLAGIPLTQQQVIEALQEQVEHRKHLAEHTQSLLQQQQPDSVVGNQQATDIVCTGQHDGAHGASSGPSGRTVNSKAAAVAAAEAGSAGSWSVCMRLPVSRRQEQVAVINSRESTDKEQQTGHDGKPAENGGWSLGLPLQSWKRYRCCMWSRRVRSP